jgi:hydroxyacylglutathione hydrolase
MRPHPLPALGDNYIWTLAADDGACLVVDPGEAGPVLRAADQGLRPAAVLLTHHHADHIGGTDQLRERWPELQVFAPDDDRIPAATRRVSDGETLAVGAWRFQVIAIPGHTRSHVAFVSEDAAQGGPVFCGDTLFSLGCGRMFEGTPPQMLASLDRLAALPGQAQVCCGHEYTVANAAFAGAVEPGNPAVARRAAQAAALRARGEPTVPSTLQDERAANPFLRVDEPEVRHSVASRLGREPDDRVEVFAELRRWKDGFQA